MRRRYLRGNPVRLLMYDGHMETVENLWANWCTLDWTVGFCHKTGEIYFLGIHCSASECAKRYIVVAGGMNYVNI